MTTNHPANGPVKHGKSGWNFASGIAGKSLYYTHKIRTVQASVGRYD